MQTKRDGYWGDFFKLVFGMMLLFNAANAIYGFNANGAKAQIAATLGETLTKQMIGRKKRKAMREARRYKQELEKKKTALKTLLNKVMGVEQIMRRNYTKRKKLIKQWEAFYRSQGGPLPQR
jgi:hypothetical protein